jgi:hypothetical protein
MMLDKNSYDTVYNCFNILAGSVWLQIERYLKRIFYGFRIAECHGAHRRPSRGLSFTT